MHWQPAPLGWAQVIELRTRTVRLMYRCRNGRGRFPIVRAAELARIQGGQEGRDPLLPLFNPLGRAAMGKSKTFEIA